MIGNIGNARCQSGLTLIELMVAMILGLLVSAGIITVFQSTSASGKAINQLATLQEDGRFAMTRLSDDISMANAQYCSGSAGKARPTAGGPSLDDLRSPKVFASSGLLGATGALADVTTPWGNPYPAAPLRPFAIPEYLSMRGYDCPLSGNCQPADPNTTVGGIPAKGTAIGDRVVGTSILTLRYLDSSMGWSIGAPGGSSVDTDGNITIAPLEGEPEADVFEPGHLAMLADCSLSQVYAVNGQGTAALTPQASPGGNFEKPGAMTGVGGQAVRLFDFNRAFQTVTYYLQVVDAGQGRTTGALIRRLNGVDQELVRGLERLDFRYGVLDDTGSTRFLTANQVDTATNCPSRPSDDALSKTNRTGCLWRAIKSIEVNLLMNGQSPLYTLRGPELSYTYAPDGDTTPAEPQDHAIQPELHQGFPTPLLRREFTALVAIRNYNP